MRNIIIILFFIILSPLFLSAQTITEIDSGEYYIMTLGSTDLILKADRPLTAGGPSALLVADTVFYIPATAPDDTIATLMTAAANHGRAAILQERGSNRNTTITVSQDSLIFGSYGTGNKPSLSGFTTVTGWTNRGGGIYKKYISTSVTPNMLTIDGVQYGLGREPELGTNYTYESASTNVSITDNQLSASPDYDGAEIVLYGTASSVDRCLITNHTGTTITYTNLGSNYNATSTGEYFIQNDIRTLDTFGEWHFSSADTLCVYFGAEDPDDYDVKLSTTDYLVSNTGGYDYVTIKNVNFEGANKAAVYSTSNTSYNNVLNCDINFSGGVAISLGGLNAKVDNCTVDNANGGETTDAARSGAIFLTAANAIVTNNTLTDIGLIPGQCNRLSKSIAITTNGDNAKIEYNNIDSAAYMGIYTAITGTVDTVRYNKVNATGQLRGDSGGIYLGHDHIGTLISDNIVTNVTGNGIYADEYAEGIEITGNTISGCSIGGIKLHKANTMDVNNNTCYDNEEGIIILNSENVNNLYSNSFTDNIVSIGDSTQWLMTLDDRYTGTTNLGSASGNYYVTHGGVDTLDFYVREEPTGAFYTAFSYMSAWKTLTGVDAGSYQLKNVYGSNNSQLLYNDTKVAKSFSLTGTWEDVYGNEYATSVTIQPYESLLLFKDFTLPTPNYAYGNLLVEGFQGSQAPGGYDLASWTETNGGNTGNVVDEDNTETTVTGGGTQVLKTVSNTTPSANATATRATAHHSFTSGDIAKVDVMYKMLSHGLATTSATGMVCTLQDASGNQCLEIFVYKTATALTKFYVRYYSNGALTSTLLSDVPVVAGNWYHIKAYYDIANSRVFASANDAVIIDATMTGTLRANNGRISLGHYNSTQAISGYYDLLNIDTGIFSNY